MKKKKKIKNWNLHFIYNIILCMVWQLIMKTMETITIYLLFPFFCNIYRVSIIKLNKMSENQKK
jgi:hypothetical protein